MTSKHPSGSLEARERRRYYAADRALRGCTLT
jgi:hypothetical protein